MCIKQTKSRKCHTTKSIGSFYDLVSERRYMVHELCAGRSMEKVLEDEVKYPQYPLRDEKVLARWGSRLAKL